MRSEFILLPFLMLSKVFCFSFQIPKKYIGHKNIRNIFREINKETPEYTLEHVIPQSVFKEDKNLKKDMHNLIWYPSKMNSHRSNYQYISDFIFDENTTLLDREGNKISYNSPIDDIDICIKKSKKKLFVPSRLYRGEISRASMYFLTTYPNYKDIIFDNVIDPYTILTWHHQYPVTENEMNKELIVKSYQGNDNDFIKNPAIMVPIMEDILGKKLDFFKSYKY